MTTHEAGRALDALAATPPHAICHAALRAFDGTNNLDAIVADEEIKLKRLREAVDAAASAYSALLREYRALAPAAEVQTRIVARATEAMLWWLLDRACTHKAAIKNYLEDHEQFEDVMVALEHVALPMLLAAPSRDPVCQHVRLSAEGTSYCTLAESGVAESHAAGFEEAAKLMREIAIKNIRGGMAAARTEAFEEAAKIAANYASSYEQRTPDGSEYSAIEANVAYQIERSISALAALRALETP